MKKSVFLWQIEDVKIRRSGLPVLQETGSTVLAVEFNIIASFILKVLGKFKRQSYLFYRYNSSLKISSHNGSSKRSYVHSTKPLRLHVFWHYRFSEKTVVYRFLNENPPS
jgi:hypothetical protein